MLRFVLWGVYIVGGFFLGSVMFSKLIPEKLCAKNIEKESSDGNPGAANVFMNCGVSVGFLCLILDMLKGFVPVYLAVNSFGTDKLMISLVLIAPVLGHAVAPLNRFHGGKCISTAFGELLALLPVTYVVLILAFFYILFSTLIKINPNRIRSIWAFSLFGVFAVPYLLFHSQVYVALGCAFIAITAIAKHTKHFESSKNDAPCIDKTEEQYEDVDEEIPASNVSN